MKKDINKKDGASAVDSFESDGFVINRRLIDDFDGQLLELLKKRFTVAKEIGEIKKKNGLPIFDEKREGEIIANKVKESGMDKNFIAKLFGVIFEESRRLQK